MALSTLMQTDFNFEGQTTVYKGKVREVYFIGKELLVMVVSDRLSAFDVVLPKGIPYKGQILNQIATKMLQETADIVPNWLIATPDPNVSIGYACTPFKVEMVIRGYLCGHAQREYDKGKRSLCGVSLPEGMHAFQAFEHPIITPATKAEQGDHDEDISKEEILARGIVSAEDYAVLENYTYALFQRGQDIAKQRGLLLADTKYEFGKTADGKIVLIDEIHTPDSSRYFYADSYASDVEQGKAPKQLSKEFVRQWLISNGFQGLPGQQLPVISDEYVEEVSQRYIELYEQITGTAFKKAPIDAIEQRIFKNVSAFLAQQHTKI
ncbi:MAG: phosphoribosylaminoimidazolesuccinocarboxamide synthase [Flavobacteriaceae bacterium]|nr:phosphoribosylaminoimidazolesuccinocarboxamide synthase [Flavobacteriaceae bacterium]